MKENRIPQKELEKIHSQCLRVRERVSNKNEKADVSLVFFPDDQARIRVVEEFVESVNKSQRHRNLANLIKQRRKPKPTWREVKEQFLRENDKSKLDCVRDDFIHCALATEPRKLGLKN